MERKRTITCSSLNRVLAIFSVVLFGTAVPVLAGNAQSIQGLAHQADDRPTQEAGKTDLSVQESKTSTALGPAWLLQERKVGQEGWTELMDACQKGDFAKVEALLAAGAKVEETDQHGVMPLYAAALGGQVKVMELLVKKGANVNARVEGGRTPLTGAAWKGHVEALKFLLQYGADANARKEDGSTALHTAATEGHAEALRVLLTHGVDINATDKEHQTALFLAVFAGHDEATNVLLEKGADPGIRNSQGAHALYIAAMKGSLKSVGSLLEKGADVNQPGFQGATALLPSAVNGQTEIVRLLLDRGANPNVANDKDKVTSLELAAIKGYVEIVRLLLDRGAKPNNQNDLGMTPLLRATYNGHETIVRLLLEYGADPNIGSAFLGSTPLVVASQKGHTAIVKLLIEKGAKTKNKGWFDFTSLASAAKAGDIETVKALLDLGVDVNEPSYHDQSPLRFAVEAGRLNVVKLLLERGADINQRDVWLMTPLMVAAQEGHIEIVNLLLSHGADHTAKDRGDRLSATEYALFFAKEQAKVPNPHIVDQLMRSFIDAESTRRTHTGIKARLVFIIKEQGCRLSTLDPMTGTVSIWMSLTSCPEDFFVSDKPGAVILRNKNILQVFRQGVTTPSVVSLPDPDKKGWRSHFQIAGQLWDGQLAVGYREKYRKGKETEWKWTLYSYSKGKWTIAEQKTCIDPEWCLLTPFSGRSWRDLGDEDQLWHPYLKLNPFLTESGVAEKNSEGEFIKIQRKPDSYFGYHYSAFAVNGKQVSIFYDVQPPLPNSGLIRYEIEEIYLQEPGTTKPVRLEQCSRTAVEGRMLLCEHENRLALVDLDKGTKPILQPLWASWVYWEATEKGN